MNPEEAASTPTPTTVRRVATNGVNLHVIEAGPADGPLVILLHGFPETAASWHRQIGPLVDAGYRVVAPDQRGYGTSDKPRGVAAYHLDPLVGDLVGLIGACGRERAAVVGHDWGGIVAWAAIERHPERFDLAVIVNAPHPAVIRRALRSDLAQIRRNWYLFLFQLPGLPEWLLKRRNFRALEQALTSACRPGAFDAAEIDRYRSAWGQPGAIAAMVNWYRATLRPPRPLLPAASISVPTRMIWGVQDSSLGIGLARSSYAQCQDATIEWVEDATHWVIHERPERVNRLILKSLSELPHAPN